MELPNYIPTRLLSYELPTCFNRQHSNHSQPCALPANHERPHHVAKRSPYGAVTVVPQYTTRTAVRPNQDLVAGALHCKRATAPGADAPGCACHARRLRAPATRNLAQPLKFG